MNKLPLLVTLGLVALMGACNTVESSTADNEEPTANSSVILENSEETTAEAIDEESTADSSVILEDSEETTAEAIDEEPTADSSVILEDSEETTAEGINIELENVELEDTTLEAQAEDEIPLVDAPVEGALEEIPLETEEA
ncbi:MAG: hypothetical protein AB4372_20710, partial [Xenococcus sp. (in: cyanobacteria)]